MAKVTHSIEPVFDERSQILILGSIPSPKSREIGFYYGHKQNRFWRVLGEVLDVEIPENIEGKKAVLLAQHIALWDVLAECEITGAADQSIKEAQINDLGRILKSAPIKQIFTTGKKAGELYQKLRHEDWPEKCIILPSTSAANAAYSKERLVESYRAILPYLKDGDEK